MKINPTLNRVIEIASSGKYDILPDLPFEEKEEFLPVCEKYDVTHLHMWESTSKK